MKIDELLAKLEQIRMKAEEDENWLDVEITVSSIIITLLEYINNPKVEAKVDEIPF